MAQKFDSHKKAYHTFFPNFYFWLNGKLFVTQSCILLLVFIETSFASGTVLGNLFLQSIYCASKTTLNEKKELAIVNHNYQ